jgi:2-succinyl-6-hydroxy-2,4-cyclohexadiene-1-carboxylate synthase
MGGRLALHFAVAQAEMVDRVILESASPGIADPHDRSVRQAADDELADRIERDGVAAFIEPWVAQPLFQSQSRLPEAKRARARALRLENSAAGLANSLRGMGTGAQAPLHGALRALRHPVLLVTGEYDSKFRGIAAGMQEALPDATMRIIPDTGHAPHWEAPGSCLQMVEPFLRGRVVPESVPCADRQPS